MDNATQLKKKVNQLINNNEISTPCLVMGLGLIDKQFSLLKKVLPNVEVYYSVKSNPDPLVLSHLRHLGSSFEAASLGEIQRCIEIGGLSTQVHFGNSIKKREEIARAYELGIRSFSVDSEQEVIKVAEMAPGAQVMVRLSTNGKGAVWGLSKKFGTSVARATELLRLANSLDLVPYGLSFHVGSQQQSADAWAVALKNCELVVSELKKDGIKLNAINLGGGLPANGYINRDKVMDFDLVSYLKTLKAHIDKFEENCASKFKFMLEPGRFVVANTGVVVSKVLLTAQREFEGRVENWVYMDVGKFNGLYEASDIQLPIHLLDDVNLHTMEDTVPTVLSGPSCDSDDMLLPPNTTIVLPSSLKEGDHLLFASTGAYSNSYATQSFNGFNPISVVCIDSNGELITKENTVTYGVHKIAI
ncbi:type III PLP-dependent enzyme [Pseudoalteromonas byunsanensis]|uniref:Orn/DAP/Arg decarboxylase 2 N-terminal domain-containing protein n=1 Tax=Pseudoalteromonas byunsanensis TaxID=327939 RepID=A0A1S1N7M2_9GAMM|nr:type III PLP-dependent enzyme [Pseudoalteromonas byunsanensis]OHU94264.1 hypothetical protein BIW53_14360 [Pseudoalteromonas byunsanensis]